jgi:putative transposase
VTGAGAGERSPHAAAGRARPGGRGAAGLTGQTSVPVQATPPGHVWTAALLHEHGLKGPPRQVLTVMDACTREGLALEVATSWPSPRVLPVLARLVATPGAPQVSRRENGPEGIALAVRGWWAQHQMATRDIAPGGPWQNGSGERVNGTGRDACLHRRVCHAVAEARLVLEADRRHEHEERPHRGLGDQTPVECTRDWLVCRASSIGLSHVHWSRLLGACQNGQCGSMHLSGSKAVRTEGRNRMSCHRCPDCWPS